MKPGNQCDLFAHKVPIPAEQYVQKDEGRVAFVLFRSLDSQTSSLGKRFFCAKGELHDYIQKCDENVLRQDNCACPEWT